MRSSVKRPGEKQFEELFYDRDHANKTTHSKILRADGSSIANKDMPNGIRALKLAIADEDEPKSKKHSVFADRTGDYTTITSSESNSSIA